MFIVQWAVIIGAVILIRKMWQNETKLVNDIVEMQKDLEDMRWYTSDFIPELEDLLFALQQARVGASAYGRRKNRRRLLRVWNKVKTRMTAA